MVEGGKGQVALLRSVSAGSLSFRGFKVEGDRWPSVAPNLADSGGAFSFAKASENALEG